MLHTIIIDRVYLHFSQRPLKNITEPSRLYGILYMREVTLILYFNKIINRNV